MDRRHRDADEQQEVVYNRPILIKDTQSRLQSKEQRAKGFYMCKPLFEHHVALQIFSKVKTYFRSNGG